MIEDILHFFGFFLADFLSLKMLDNIFFIEFFRAVEVMLLGYVSREWNGLRTW